MSVNVLVNGMKEEVMLDTGSSVTLIDESIEGESFKTNVVVRFADGKKKRLKEGRSFKICLGKKEEVVKGKVVRGLPVKVLLGMDFMKGKMKLDLIKGVVEIKDGDEVVVVSGVLGIEEEKEFKCLNGLNDKWKRMISEYILKFERLKKQGSFLLAKVEPYDLKIDKSCNIFCTPYKYHGEEKAFQVKKIKEWFDEGGNKTVVVKDSSAIYCFEKSEEWRD
jgi:hypothetical protein